MFNNIKNSLSYAHTKHFFLKFIVKKCENQCCTLPGRAWPIMCTKTNYIKFCGANAISFAENYR